MCLGSTPTAPAPPPRAPQAPRAPDLNSALSVDPDQVRRKGHPGTILTAQGSGSLAGVAGGQGSKKRSILTVDNVARNAATVNSFTSGVGLVGIAPSPLVKRPTDGTATSPRPKAPPTPPVRSPRNPQQLFRDTQRSTRNR